MIWSQEGRANQFNEPGEPATGPDGLPLTVVGGGAVRSGPVAWIHLVQGPGR